MKQRLGIAFICVVLGALLSGSVLYFVSDISDKSRISGIMPVPDHTYQDAQNSDVMQSADSQPGFLEYTEKDPVISGNDPESLSDGSVSLVQELFQGNELYDIQFVMEIMVDVLDNGFQKNEMLSYLTNQGFTPFEERKGHEKIGYRREIRVKEVKDDSRLIREFLGVYYENDDQYIFDRLYVGLDRREHVFEHSVKEIDQRLRGKFLRRIIDGYYARWDFADGSFIFVNGEYDFYGEEIILYGKEWEIH